MHSYLVSRNSPEVTPHAKDDVTKVPRTNTGKHDSIVTFVKSEMGQSTHKRVFGGRDISCWVLNGRKEALMRSTILVPYGFKKAIAYASASITRCGSARTVSSVPS